MLFFSIAYEIKKFFYLCKNNICIKVDTLLIISAILLTLIGIAGCIIPGLPGTVLSYAALLCCYGTDSTLISPSQLWIWLAISIVVMVLDYILPGYMTKLFGGSRASAIGATLGLFAGIIFTPIGMLLGSFLGAVIGEMLNDHSTLQQGIKAGIGSFIAFIAGTGIKLIASVWMAWLVIKDIIQF